MTREQQIKELKTYSYHTLMVWLINNFTPERFHDKNDIVESAHDIMLSVYDPHNNSIFTIEFLNRLWGMHGELPEYIYNIDRYDRLTDWVPNYAKPGVRERVAAFVDEHEPSQAQLERWGRG